MNAVHDVLLSLLLLAATGALGSLAVYIWVAGILPALPL